MIPANARQVEITADVPARLGSLLCTIHAGSTAMVEPPHDAGGVRVCRVWPRHSSNPAPMAVGYDALAGMGERARA